MDIKLLLIFLLIFSILILLFLYIKKMWIFRNPNLITFEYTQEGSCRTDLQECKCSLEVESSDGSKKEETLSNYNMENKYYKVKQDLMPYWSNWSECNAYGIKNRKRIYGPNNSFDIYNSDGEKTSTPKSDMKNYVLHSCDLVPCENLGLNKTKDKNLCKIRSEGLDPQESNDDFNLNTNKCDPIITFQKSSDINSSCNNASQRLPFLQVNFDDNAKEISYYKDGDPAYNSGQGSFKNVLQIDFLNIGHLNNNTAIGLNTNYF